MSRIDEQPFPFESGGLRLEGMLHAGDGALSEVVLHPHPQYGGDMDNHVILIACGALAACGATTLRFNFRGTGASEGRFDGGRGEADDARAAIAAVRSLTPDAALVVAGYSFGAMVAAGVAADSGLRALILISPPVGYASLPTLPYGLETLLVTGELDDVAAPEAVQALAADDRVVAVVPGAGHAWWPGADALSAEISRFLSGIVDVR